MTATTVDIGIVTEPQLARVHEHKKLEIIYEAQDIIEAEDVDMLCTVFRDLLNTIRKGPLILCD